MHKIEGEIALLIATVAIVGVGIIEAVKKKRQGRAKRLNVRPRPDDRAALQGLPTRGQRGKRAQRFEELVCGGHVTLCMPCHSVLDTVKESILRSDDPAVAAWIVFSSPKPPSITSSCRRSIF